MVGPNVILKVTAILALAALAVYLFTRAASGRGLVWGDIPRWVTGAGTRTPDIESSFMQCRGGV